MRQAWQRAYSRYSPRVMRIAHLSDLHVLAPLGVELRRVLFNKRVTGYANLLMKRARVYRREYLLAVLEHAAGAADHVVVTGDITNLSLEGEYHEALRLLDQVARHTELSVIPGNHDIYLPAVHHERRFPHHFSRYMQSDLPELALELAAGHFPFVKLRGPAAIIGVTSAVPRPPFVSAGYVGHEQLAALERILQHPEVAQRTPIVLIHHSPFDSRFRIEQLRGGLVDARALRGTLATVPHGLLLYGHLHVRRRAQLTTERGLIEAVCASAAPLDHPHDRVRAGYNLYELGDDGRVQTISARVLQRESMAFLSMSLPPEQGKA